MLLILLQTLCFVVLVWYILLLSNLWPVGHDKSETLFFGGALWQPFCKPIHSWLIGLLIWASALHANSLSFFVAHMRIIYWLKTLCRWCPKPEHFVKDLCFLQSPKPTLDTPIGFEGFNFCEVWKLISGANILDLTIDPTNSASLGARIDETLCPLLAKKCYHSYLWVKTGTSLPNIYYIL